VPQRRYTEAGLTFLELIAAIGIVGVLALLALPNFATFRTSFQLMSATRTTAQFVRLARAIAVGRNLPSRIVVSGNGSTMTTQIFRSGAWTSIGTPMVLVGGTSVSAVQPSASALTFSSQGIAAATVTITLRASGGDQKSVVVSLLGSVNAA
jgi:Tfp pilus assembly protein FimT